LKLARGAEGGKPQGGSLKGLWHISVQKRL